MIQERLGVFFCDQALCCFVDIPFAAGYNIFKRILKGEMHHDRKKKTVYPCDIIFARPVPVRFARRLRRQLVKISIIDSFRFGRR